MCNRRLLLDNRNDDAQRASIPLPDVFADGEAISAMAWVRVSAAGATKTFSQDSRLFANQVRRVTLQREERKKAHVRNLRDIGLIFARSQRNTACMDDDDNLQECQQCKAQAQPKLERTRAVLLLIAPQNTHSKICSSSSSRWSLLTLSESNSLFKRFFCLLLLL